MLDSYVASFGASRDIQNKECRAVGTGAYQSFFQWRHAGATTWNNASYAVHYWSSSKACSSQPDQSGWYDPDPNDDEAPAYCFNGCKYEGATETGGPGTVIWVPSGSVCTSQDAPEPSIDTDGDGVPDEDDAFPNDPNESADTDGDGIGDNADFSPNDPTDGSDEPGDEDGDDEGDNTASGGGDCKAPPSCKGDGIQCNQLFQQWQIRCSGATVTGDPTNCSSGYSCSGDSVQCATVALLRKTACATAGDGDGGTGGTRGDGNGNGVPDVLEGSGAGDTGDPGESDDVTRFGIGVDASLLDQENIFGGGSCPAPPSLTIMGKTISGSDFPYWCQAMAILRVLILIFGAFTAVKILTGWGFS
ncbi:virulence factor TspB C-terminal domain-related protein [Pseudoxanthomonas mexicana]